MSELRLIVRDGRRALQGDCDSLLADQTVAALAAEPETIEELEAALARFRRPMGKSLFDGFAQNTGQASERPATVGLVVVDLAARLVMCDTAGPCPDRDGYVPYHCPQGHDEHAEENWVRYHLSEDWLLLSAASDWREQAEARRRERAEKPPLDARSVLYGNPLLEFLAGESFAAFGSNPAPIGAVMDTYCPQYLRDGEPQADQLPLPSDEDCDRVREIHIAWLMTSRDDLRGGTPRDVMLAKRDHINWDLQDRSEQWSRQGKCPPGLDPHSAAFRLAGFGTHELVKYYELIRQLLWSCRQRLGEIGSPASKPSESLLTKGDFLTSEVPRLALVRDTWLMTPDVECHGMLPREIIDHERARLPEGMSGHEAIVDHDCPLCQMMADLPGPMFWHLDGCNMDDDFAFEMYCRTREEWDAKQRKYEEFSRKFNAEREELDRLGVGYSEQTEEVRQRRYFVDDSPGLPLEVRLFGIGGELAELIVELKTPPDERSLIDQLSRDFGNLREVLRSGEPELTSALIGPVIDRFCETIDTVAATRSGLAEKCQALEDRLRKFLEPPGEASYPFDELSSDDDLPF